MVSPPVSQPKQMKDATPAPISSDVSAKQAVPVWVIFLVLFLFSLIVGMGIYIGFQKGLFQKNIALLVPTETPPPTPVTSSTITPGADWKTYRDENAGFTLKYPPTVLLNEYTDGSASSALSISVEALDAIAQSMPLGMDRKTALADRDSLEKGIAQTIGDFVASDALVRIGGTYNGRMTSTLSRFEVCSVLFTRSLVFYPNNYRVIISLNGNNEQIMLSMPEFFTTDPTNCGEMKIWNRDRMGEFMPTLSKGQGKGTAQIWYDTFDAIMKTIELIQPSNVVSSPPVSPSVCDVSDSTFCKVLADIKGLMAANNYAGLIAHQTTTTVTCDPDGMAIAICEGFPKGTVKVGYSKGYNQSEGTVQTKDQHLASLASYVSENGPFIYKGSLQSGDKGMIVYLNGDASQLFALYMKRIDSSWRITTVLVGGTWGDDEFINLSPSLLERVQ